MPRTIALAIASSLLLLPLSRHAGGLQPSSLPAPGVVVEKVDKDSDAEKFGFAPGDLILRWTRGESSGVINSPFDLLEIEIEQLPQGAISLEGRRGPEEKKWVWTANTEHRPADAAWGLATRPYLSGLLLVSYQAAETAAGSGRAAEAAHLWQAIAADKNLDSSLSAWLLLRSAQSLIVAKQWSQADADCQKAARLSVSTGVHVLRLCGDAFAQADQAETAEKYYRQAMAGIQPARAQSLTAASLLAVTARLLLAHGDAAKPKELLAQALEMQQRLVPTSMVASANLHTLGFLYFKTDDLKKAGQLLEMGVAIRQRLAPESALLAASLQLWGDILTAGGNTDQALPRLLRAVEILQRNRPNSLLLAGCLLDAAGAMDDAGDGAKAEELLRQALAIQRKLSPKGGGVASSLNNLGLILQERGQLLQAEAAFKESLALQRAIAAESTEVANSLGNIAIIERRLGHLDEAERYLNQSIAIHEKDGPAFLLAGDYNDAGELAFLRGDLSAADRYYRKGLETAHAAAPNGHEEGDSFQGLGDVEAKRDAAEDAEKNYRRALDIRKKTGPGTWRHAETLLALAQLAQRSHKLEAAADLFRQGLEVVEDQTNRMGSDSEARAAFRSQYDASYKSYIALLIEQGDPGLALQVLERSRGRSWIEMLSAAHINIRTGVDRNLVGRERSLRADIAANSDRRIGLLGDNASQDKVAANDKELDRLLAEYRDVQAEIRLSSPAYAALTQPQPMNAVQIEQLLDAETLLLEYSLGDERSYVFTVTSDSVSAYELPRKTGIEALARRIYQVWTAQNRISPQESTLHRQARLHRADKISASLLVRLSRVILGPVATQLKGKRLLIVSDGALQYIPFAALPSPNSLNTALVQDHAPLVTEHEIINLPSASLLATLRQCIAARKRAPKAVAVLADPVFAKNDVRVLAGVASRKPQAILISKRNANDEKLRGETAIADSAGQLTRSAADLGLLRQGQPYLPRLPFSRREAQAILSVTPKGQGMEALDFRASRATAVSPDLSQYRVLHFATHGLLNNAHPELSGLVFSLVDSQGRPQGGFLGLEDVYNLNLHADLVVLSACETALGKEIQGEGLLGLTRGFMYAGASQVVASLWSVDDAATAELMRLFYKAMEQDGLKPAAALRHAQIEIRKQQRWSRPYYWAGFVIQGEWSQPVESPHGTSNN